MTFDEMRDFRTAKADRLLDLLVAEEIASQEDAAAVVYALVEIAESVEMVYGKLLPKILNESNAGQTSIKEQIWDLREEFRHIDYHIHDGRLTEL